MKPTITPTESAGPTVVGAGSAFRSSHLSARRQSGAISRKVIIWLSIPVFIVLFVAGWGVVVKQRYLHERAVWKDKALAQIADTSMTNEVVVSEINEMKHLTPNLDWAHYHVLLMTNNEVLVYAFRHGYNNGFVDHLFLAHGSNGRWYYSTYHFCNSMAAVRGEDPPSSIAEFAKRYAVREFDGKSDICLQHTWP